MVELGPKICGKRRSIVRRIGSFLPLKPPPKIYVSVTPLHSMSGSMINQETSSGFSQSNGFGLAADGRLSTSKPDLLEPISFGSEVRLLALEQELQELRSQVSSIVKSTNEKQKHYPSMSSLSNGSNSNSQQFPPPPPPLPPPSTPHIARRASLQDHKLEERKKPLLTQKSMGDILKDIDKVKLRPIERSPGGRPVRQIRASSPCNDLQAILRRRYVTAMSPDSSRNSTLNLDESF